MSIKIKNKIKMANSLTVLSVLGVVGTGITSGFAGAKLSKIEDKKEKWRDCIKPVAPAVLTAGLTIGSIVLNHGVNKNIRNSLSATSSMLLASLWSYQDEKPRLIKNRKLIEAYNSNTDSKIYYIEMFDIYFVANPLDVANAEYMVNKTFSQEGMVGFDEYLELLGMLPYMCMDYVDKIISAQINDDLSEYETLCWDAGRFDQTDGAPWIEFEHTEVSYKTLDEDCDDDTIMVDVIKMTPPQVYKEGFLLSHF